MNASSSFFFFQFLKAPRRIGAVASSSSELAQTMVDCADIQAGHTVVEVGAGTGVVTQALLGVTPLTLVLEPHPPFVQTLRSRFPEIEISEAFARDLPSLIAPGSVNRAVSSLPWAAWRPVDQERELAGILTVLNPEGVLVTFSYVHSVLLPGFRRFEDSLASKFEAVERSEVTWRNLPPAFVLTARRLVAPTS